ncbi:single-stranded-DNA-specific exonuclease RecJ [Flectobacillus sp. DC10W]|uniref:Single-stranded-DNA-specific exonuclease RecJ n=1 Tax=Flectobacillus longus TaxID=2984207 RepID=A0ABT6YUT8_9BACT|nr:single-stranded-DNA-specific exonuclease RecJ [Flectobacillus longus]MDI9867350.1 single-stranded-DNA-specific exonuclease RecJ [Flectobacillus longus]
MVEKRWNYKKLPSSEIVDTLSKELGVSYEIATLLGQRGVGTFDEAKHFFRPSLSDLYDPFLMADMTVAVERLSKAVEQNEKILIYGDYDVDGTTSVAMFYGFLQKYIHQNIEFYIPDRYAEGYGVSQKGIEYAAENGFALIVSLDCGIKSVDKVAWAKEHGVDFIICDHHRPGDELPDAVAVLDPKREDCQYPFKELTGCGVGFKLLQAYCQVKDIDVNLLLPYLDLVVTSISCDIVPIVGENRVLAFYGLQQLNTNPRTGLKALIKSASLEGKMDITKVVFGLGPRINAAGRIRHAYDAVDLMLSEDEQKAEEFARVIGQHNTDRKGLDSSITAEALEMIAQNSDLVAAKSTVLFNEAWHKGVIGIVASRCIEKYHRPTIILTESHGNAAGSARSVPGFDVYDAIEECSEHLIQFGGHTFAAGLTLELNQIENFKRKFEEVVSRKILQEQLSPLIEIDLALPLSAITDKFHRIMSQMSPFGPQNMTPVFVSHKVKLYGAPIKMKEKHLKFQAFQEGSAAFTCVGFGMVEDFFDKLLETQTCSICYTIEINEWQGKKSFQLMLKDIKFE